MTRKQLRLYCCTLLALSLAGCDPSQKTNAPAGEQQATAPALPTPRAATPQSPVLDTHEQRRVRHLIQQVHAAYDRGVADYRKGKLPEAKEEFDRAVDLMLTSGISIKSDAQLQDEFDRIVDAVNTLEMEALKEGNGFVQKVEPSPADVASDVTFEVDPNIVAKARNELATTKSDLPLVVNDYVAVYINFFANTQRGHNTLLHSLQRAGRYKAMIQQVMAEEGVPQDLIYLAVAESGFQPRAMNPHTGAGGMWQFMPHGNYGLVRNGYVDERFDPQKSTRAYARYMKFNYKQLGDWYLSMAGYDWGAGNVQRAVQKTGYADFWELYKRNNLPTETKNYVPEILAAIIIANNPKQYGFDEIALDPPVLTDTVTISYSVDLKLVSDIVGAPMDELTALNPSLLRSITPPDTSFDLHLPAGTAALFEKRIAEIPESRRTAWRYHRVAASDTLASVAHQYRVTVADLAAANRLSENDSTSGIEALVIPSASSSSFSSAASSSSSPSSSSSSSAHTLLYTVRKGDTLVTIADRFGVSLDQLRRWNNLTGVKVKRGRRLHVAEAANVPHASRSHRRNSTASASEETSRGKRVRGRGKAHEASPEKDSVKEPSVSSKHKKGRAATAKKDRTQKSATAPRAKKAEPSSAKNSRAEKPTVKHKSSARKRK